MTYNLDFLYASVFFVGLILLHFLHQKKLDDFKNRMFLTFLIIGLADILLDIVTTWLLYGGVQASVSVTKFLLTVFYLLQVMIPFILNYYALTLREEGGFGVRILGLHAVVPCVMLLVVTLNFWGGYLFRFDVDGTYTKGPLYPLMYFYAACYALYVLADSMIHYKKMGKRNLFVICEFTALMMGCVALQYATGYYLMTGFGIGLGLLILYLNVSNPNRYIDRLTDAFDSRYFGEWAQSRMQRDTAFHILAIEMHKLKVINKIFGTSRGDRLLAEIARKMQELCRSGQVFRLSGSRLVLAADSLVEYERMRREILAYFDEDLELDGELVSFPILLCGITNANEWSGYDELLSYMEYLFSLPKERERTVLIQGDKQSLQSYRYTKEIERYLSVAVRDDLFEVYFQPLYSIPEKRFVAAEALSRLRHPTLGAVSPEVFIQIAEKNGMIAQIGFLQFRKICAFLKANPELMHELNNVKFNMSPAEILQEDYSRKVLRTIREYDLPADFFRVEITETVATEYSRHLYRIVDELREAGIKLCLDDFGSGYANLNTVLRLPFSEIKLDRSLLNGIRGNENVARFYHSMVEVIRHMGYETVAEGVETEEELRLVEEWGVEYIQGYIFSRPLPGAELSEFLKKQTSAGEERS